MTRQWQHDSDLLDRFFGGSQERARVGTGATRGMIHESYWEIVHEAARLSRRLLYRFPCGLVFIMLGLLSTFSGVDSVAYCSMNVHTTPDASSDQLPTYDLVSDSAYPDSHRDVPHAERVRLLGLIGQVPEPAPAVDCTVLSPKLTWCMVAETTFARTKTTPRSRSKPSDDSQRCSPAARFAVRPLYMRRWETAQFMVFATLDIALLIVAQIFYAATAVCVS